MGGLYQLICKVLAYSKHLSDCSRYTRAEMKGRLQTESHSGTSFLAGSLEAQLSWLALPTVDLCFGAQPCPDVSPHPLTVVPLGVLCLIPACCGDAEADCISRQVPGPGVITRDCGCQSRGCMCLPLGEQSVGREPLCAPHTICIRTSGTGWGWKTTPGEETLSLDKTLSWVRGRFSSMEGCDEEIENIFPFGVSWAVPSSKQGEKKSVMRDLMHWDDLVSPQHLSKEALDSVPLGKGQNFYLWE